MPRGLPRGVGGGGGWAVLELTGTLENVEVLSRRKELGKNQARPSLSTYFFNTV